MSQLRFPLWVAITSIALVAALYAVGVFGVASVFAGGPPWMGHAGGFGRFGDDFGQLRSAHVELVDQAGQPSTIDVVVGTVASATASGVTLTLTDGSTRSYTIDGQTRVGRQPVAGEKARVVTKNGASNATAIFAGGADGFGKHGGRGWGHPR